MDRGLAVNTAGKVLRAVAGTECVVVLFTWQRGLLEWGLALLIAVPTVIVALGALELTDADVPR